MERLTVMVNNNNKVYITWIEGNASGTLTLEPEHAIEIGFWGEMAKTRELFIQEIEND